MFKKNDNITATTTWNAAVDRAISFETGSLSLSTQDFLKITLFINLLLKELSIRIL